MPAFALRFVGQEALPPRLSEFDLEQFFTLLSDDVAAIRAQFRSDHRLPAALILLFMRSAGRPLDGFNVLPRSLLRKTAEALAVSPPSIASLRSIYKRRQTLSKHQLWAKTYLGLRELEPDDEAALTATLLAHAADASHSDDLVRSAGQWLFTRRILIPTEWRRHAPGVAEGTVEASRPQHPCRDLEKVRYLKALGAHDWNLSAVSLAKQQAYARQVQARRPVKTRDIKPSRQLIELVCFLRVTLLKLTDVALLQSSRRSQQLFREAEQGPVEPSPRHVEHYLETLVDGGTADSKLGFV